MCANDFNISRTEYMKDEERPMPSCVYAQLRASVNITYARRARKSKRGHREKASESVIAKINIYIDARARNFIVTCNHLLFIKNARICFATIKLRCYLSHTPKHSEYDVCVFFSEWKAQCERKAKKKNGKKWKYKINMWLRWQCSLYISANTLCITQQGRKNAIHTKRTRREWKKNRSIYGMGEARVSSNANFIQTCRFQFLAVALRAREHARCVHPLYRREPDIVQLCVVI